MIYFDDAQKIRVLLIEDEEIIRLGTSMLLESQENIELVASVADIDTAIGNYKRVKIDIFLLDLFLDSGPVSERIPELKAALPNSKILLFTSVKSVSNMHLKALKNGANGLIMKHQPLSLLLQAIRSVVRGELWIDQLVVTSLLNANIIDTEPSDAKSFPSKHSSNSSELSTSRANKICPSIFGNSLTQREQSIALLAASGFSSKKIAQELSIAEKTVRNNLTIIYQKLGVNNRMELLLLANPR